MTQSSSPGVNRGGWTLALEGGLSLFGIVTCSVLCPLQILTSPCFCLTSLVFHLATLIIIECGKPSVIAQDTLTLWIPSELILHAQTPSAWLKRDYKYIQSSAIRSERIYMTHVKHSMCALNAEYGDQMSKLHSHIPQMGDMLRFFQNAICMFFCAQLQMAVLYVLETVVG